VTTGFTRPIKTIAEAVQQLPRGSLVPARKIHHLFDATTRLHPERSAPPVLTKNFWKPDEIRFTHRGWLVEMSRAVNL
jgi:fatty-acyl-CoA synthase